MSERKQDENLEDNSRMKIVKLPLNELPNISAANVRINITQQQNNYYEGTHHHDHTTNIQRSNDFTINVGASTSTPESTVPTDHYNQDIPTTMPFNIEATTSFAQDDLRPPNDKTINQSLMSGSFVGNDLLVNPGPVNLVQYDETSEKLVLKDMLILSIFKNPEICDMPIAIISVTGESRSGKSFLLNFFVKYLTSIDVRNQNNIQTSEDWIDWRIGEKFESRVGPEAVTDGMYIWNRPFIVELQGKRVALFLVDTIGTNDTKYRAEIWNKLFTMTMMLTSFNICNFKEKIDQNALNSIQMYSEIGGVMLSSMKREDVQQIFKPFMKVNYLVRDWKGREPCGKDEAMNSFKIVNKETRTMVDKVHGYFTDHSAYLLPTPGYGVTEDDYKDGKQDGSSRSITFFDFLKEYIKMCCESVTPKQWNGEQINCGVFATHFINCFRHVSLNNFNQAIAELAEEIKMENILLKFWMEMNDGYKNVTYEEPTQLGKRYEATKEKHLRAFNKDEKIFDVERNSEAKKKYYKILDGNIRKMLLSTKERYASNQERFMMNFKLLRQQYLFKIKTEALKFVVMSNNYGDIVDIVGTEHKVVVFEKCQSCPNSWPSVIADRNIESFHNDANDALQWLRKMTTIIPSDGSWSVKFSRRLFTKEISENLLKDAQRSALVEYCKAMEQKVSIWRQDVSLDDFERFHDEWQSSLALKFQNLNLNEEERNASEEALRQLRRLYQSLNDQNKQLCREVNMVAESCAVQQYRYQLEKRQLMDASCKTTYETLEDFNTSNTFAWKVFDEIYTKDNSTQKLKDDVSLANKLGKSAHQFINDKTYFFSWKAVGIGTAIAGVVVLVGLTGGLAAGFAPVAIIAAGVADSIAIGVGSGAAGGLLAGTASGLIAQRQENLKKLVYTKRPNVDEMHVRTSRST